MNAKINLRTYITVGYLPEGVEYKNYTMLVAIANYSENNVCKGNAEMMLDEDVSLERKTQVLWGMGGFMKVICRGTFAEAWNRADGNNKDALIEALTNNEIEL